MRTSNALDPTLRTLQVELELDNANREVFPGAYAEVHFKLPASAETLRLPANTVLFRAAGLQVATVDGQQRVKLKSIVQGRDFGNTIEVLSGLDSQRNGRFSIRPDSITDGVQVRIASRARPPREGRLRQARPRGSLIGLDGLFICARLQDSGQRAGREPPTRKPATGKPAQPRTTRAAARGGACFKIRNSTRWKRRPATPTKI